MRHVRLLALLPLLAIGSLAAPAARAQEPFYEDGFESGNSLAWAQSFGEPALTLANAFRTSELELRDPHLFVQLPIFGCFDFTDNDLPLSLGPSFNSQLAEAIETDGDGDGYLDLSLLLLGRPLQVGAAPNTRLDTALGNCPGPFPATSCDRDGDDVPQTHYYSTQGSGLCLDALAGTTSGYSPAITPVAASCFVTAARGLSLEVSGVSLPLAAVQVGATFLGSPPSSLAPGLLRGFLTEAAADSILLPADLPVVGGQPFSILLPGGDGNCANHDARDTFGGQSGWWFYLSSTAVPVIWTGP